MKRAKTINNPVAIIIAIICISFFVSCQKEVHINLASGPPQVVVQGAVETGLPPYVILTSTIGFFSNITLATLESSFLHGATITVSDGTNTVPLREYTIDTGNNNKFYIYSVDTANLGNIMIGQVGKFYTLSITYNKVTYTSVTKIPNPKGVDTMWFATPTFQSNKLSDSAMQLFVNYTDPDTPGNYVKYFTRRNSEPYYPSGLYSDQAVNGLHVANIGLYAGYDNTIDANGDSLRYFYPGDTVYLKWCEIDYGVYNFWNTLDFASSSDGNPFASPINIQTNMSNGALGVWAGYGSIITRKVVN